MMFSLTIVAADGLNIETTTSDGSSIMTADVQGDDFAGNGGQKPATVRLPRTLRRRIPIKQTPPPYFLSI